jgi:hypothetical protein
MTSNHLQKNKPAPCTPEPTELKAAAIEDSILDRYPHDVEDDINAEHPEAEKAEVVDAETDDRPVSKETSNS